MDIKNRTIPEIMEKVARLRDTSGRKMTKIKKPVYTKRHSIQGEWQPNQILGEIKLTHF